MATSLERVLPLVGGLYDAAMDASQWTSFLECVRVVFEAEQASVWTMSPQTVELALGLGMESSEAHLCQGRRAAAGGADPRAGERPCRPCGVIRTVKTPLQHQPGRTTKQDTQELGLATDADLGEDALQLIPPPIAPRAQAGQRPDEPHVARSWKPYAAEPANSTPPASPSAVGPGPPGGDSQPCSA